MDELCLEVPFDVFMYDLEFLGGKTVYWIRGRGCSFLQRNMMVIGSMWGQLLCLFFTEHVCEFVIFFENQREIGVGDCVIMFIDCC